MKRFLTILAVLMPAPALAAEGVTLSSKALVERVEVGPDGKQVTVRKEPTVVTPGDQVVFVLSYRNSAPKPVTAFVLTNPIPDSVAYDGTGDAGATVSVDGGKSWGSLATLKIKQADGALRPAAAADVTHVRWAFANAIPSGAEGRLSFRGIVK